MMSPDLKARLRLGDPTLWLLRDPAKHYCVAEENSTGGLTWLFDLSDQDWAYIYATPSQDIYTDEMEHRGLHWVKPPPWLKE